MGNTNYSRNASCAHLTVLWVSMQTTGGLTTGWWQCKDCGHRFYPAHPSWDSAPRPATPEGHRPELTYYEGIVKKVADIADEPTTPKELAVRLRELVLFGQTYDVRAATPEREPPPNAMDRMENFGPVTFGGVPPDVQEIIEAEKEESTRNIATVTSKTSGKSQTPRRATPTEPPPKCEKKPTRRCASCQAVFVGDGICPFCNHPLLEKKP